MFNVVNAEDDSQAMAQADKHSQLSLGDVSPVACGEPFLRLIERLIGLYGCRTGMSCRHLSVPLARSRNRTPGTLVAPIALEQRCGYSRQKH